MNNREIIQNTAVEYSLNNKNLILELATGVGKTKALLKCIDACKSKKKWLILVSEITLIENFKQDVIKHGYEYLLNSKIEDIICYASLKNYKDTEYNIGADEAHHISDLRLNILSSIDSDKRILLSATISKEIKDKLEILGNWKIYTISTQEAINLNILPEPELYIKYLELDNTKKDFIFKTSKGSIKTTASDYYNKLDSKINYWKEEYELKGGEWRKNNWMFAAINRKRWLAEYKTNEAKNILNSLKNERTVVFTGTVKQAQLLGSKYAVHSKNTTKQNQELIDDFNELRSNKLFACGMLQEGHNLSEIQNGLIIQLANNERYTTQVAGRVLRSLAPKIFILCIKGTQDQYYLDKALQLFNNKPKII